MGNQKWFFSMASKITPPPFGKCIFNSLCAIYSKSLNRSLDLLKEKSSMNILQNFLFCVPLKRENPRFEIRSMTQVYNCF